MKKILWYLLASVAVISVWQYFGSTSTNIRLYISSPWLMIVYFTGNFSGLMQATLTTVVEATAGLVLSTGIAFGAMYVCFAKPKLLDLILPVMIASQVVPTIVLAPLFIVLLGIGLASKIALAAIISFFPTFVNFVQGYKAISPNIHELMDIYQAPLSFRIKRVYFPLSMPSIMAGLKVSATVAVIGAIVAEFTGAKNGIGKNLFISSIRLNPDLMMVSVVLAALIGFGLYALVIGIERKYGSWYLLNNH